MSDEAEHRELGMDRPIARRDFIGGIAVAAAALGAPRIAAAAIDAAASQGAEAADAATYPPLRAGLRGQYPGSFEMAHAARDGQFNGPIKIDHDLTEDYDLIVVGGGISGLSAAYFFQRDFGPDARILVLDNHDDFGGHAKRNEFRHDGRTYIGYGGTMSVETPYPYSFTAKALLRELGVTVEGYAKHETLSLYKGLGRGVFFDKENFGQDRLVSGFRAKPWPQFFAEAPLSDRARVDLIRLHTQSVDYMPSLDPSQKAERLKTISYKDFLLEHVKIAPDATPFFAGEGFRNNKRLDTCPAYEAARSGAPGFDGMKIDGEPAFDSHFEAHFPDGNATIARLLVNRLAPDAWPGQLDMNTVVTAPVDYSKLDHSGAPVRIRLSSMAIRVEHEGEPRKSRSVSVIYVKDGQTCRARGGSVIMACFNNIIRFIVPDLPDVQKTALAYPSKVPMQYTNVLIRNWRAFQRLGVSFVSAPNGYHTNFGLDQPVSLGAYKFNASPDDPIVVHMGRNPNAPGHPRREQNRLGRMDMLATSFTRSELEIRRQLARTLGPGGFDPSTDILAITVNRWPHGYAYTYDTLGDPEFAEWERPHVIGRRPFGRIAIANADSGAAAFTNEAIDQAERAVHDVLYSRGLV